MEINIKEMKIERNKIKATFDLIADIDKIGQDSYRTSSIVSRVEEEVSRAVSDKIINEKSDELIKDIDMESIIKRIQLNVVNNIVNPRDQYR